MAKERQPGASPTEGTISIVGPGMKVVGDLETEGTLRIEGVVEGSVRAAKAVVVGKEGSVNGDVHTQDAVIAGKVVGRVVAESRLELQATSTVDGEVFARRLQLDEGAIVNGPLKMGDMASVPSRVGDREATRSVDSVVSFDGAVAGPN